MIYSKERAYDSIHNLDADGKTNSSDYWNIAFDGIKARADKEGMTHYLTFGRKNIADFNLDKTKTAQKLNVYSGFTQGGSQQGSTLLQNRKQGVKSIDQEMKL